MADATAPSAPALVAPAECYRDSYIAMLREHQEQGRFLDSRHVENDPLRLARDFRRFVASLEALADESRVRPGRVAESFFWLIVADEVVGRSTLRHTLSDEPMLRHLGHIGYDVRPSAQGRGYGKLLLEMTLHQAHLLGIPKALLTCDSNNPASQHIIEQCGGVLEGVVTLPGRSYTRLRYWITPA